MKEAKEWLQMRLLEFHREAKVRDCTRMELADFNATIHQFMLSKDSLQSPSAPHMGRANAFYYPQPKRHQGIKEEEQQEVQEIRREVSSVAYHASTPSTMGMG